jgi:hypothetical protein
MAEDAAARLVQQEAAQAAVTREMVALANRRRYDGPIEAIVAIFEIGTEYLMTMMVPSVLGALALGGVLSAIFAERASRVWR